MHVHTHTRAHTHTYTHTTHTHMYTRTVDSPLSTVDLGNNKISSLEGIQAVRTLEELWMSSCSIDTFEALSPLTSLPGLTCLYLEHNPLSKDFEYRMRITQMLTSLQQLDATDVVRRS